MSTKQFKTTEFTPLEWIQSDVDDSGSKASRQVLRSDFRDIEDAHVEEETRIIPIGSRVVYEFDKTETSVIVGQTLGKVVIWVLSILGQVIWVVIILVWTILSGLVAALVQSLTGLSNRPAADDPYLSNTRRHSSHEPTKNVHIHITNNINVK